MSLVSDVYPTLINGVSQQPASVRLPSQGSLQDNGYSSPVDGLMKRSPTEWIAKLDLTLLSETPLVHFVNRDNLEQYVVVVDSDGKVYVFSLEGEHLADAGPNAQLVSTNPQRDIKALTLGDTTFILNTTQVVTMTGDTTTEDTGHAVVWIRQGNYSTRYSVTLNGTEYYYTTDAADVTKIQTDYIAAHLTTDGTGSGTPLPGTVSGSQIKLDSVSSVSVTDSAGGLNTRLVWKDVGKFSDLPNIAVDDMVIKVSGDKASDQDDYWVRFETTDGTSFGQGLWVECPKPNIPYKLEQNSLPWKLVRNSAESFSLGFFDWNDRVVGDEEGSPEPSFVDNTISDLFLFKNRLGFLSGTNVILSRSGDLLNFWRSTMLSIRDDDPIDVEAAHPRVVELHYAVPFSESLILFGSDTQLVLAGNDTLTPKTVNISFATEYTADPNCRPKTAGNLVFFPFSNGPYAGLREYFVDQTSGTKQGNLVTAHVPKYISGRLTSLTTSTTEDILVGVSDGDRSACYIYKWLFNGSDKVQSSVSRWTLGPTGTQILQVFFVGPVLWLLIKRADGIHLEKLNVAPGHTDDDAEYITHLDQRITEEDCLSVTYDPNRDVTTYVLPYNRRGTVQVVSRVDPEDDSWLPAVVQKLGHQIQDRTYHLFVEDISDHEEGDPTHYDDHLTFSGPITLADDQLTFTASGPGFATLSFDSIEEWAHTDTTFWPYVNGERVLDTDGDPIELAEGDSCTYPVREGDSLRIWIVSPAYEDGYLDSTVSRTQVTDLTADGGVGNQVRVSGNLVGKPVYIGHQYEFRFGLTTPMLRTQSQIGGIQAVTGGRLQVHKVSLDYNDSGYFRVEVTQDARDTSTYIFTAKRIGVSDTLIGEVPLDTDTFSFRVMSKNTEAEIEIVNDSFLPSRFTGGDWEGDFQAKARRI